MRGSLTTKGSLSAFSEELIFTWCTLCNVSLAISAVSLGYAASVMPPRHSGQWWLLVAKMSILVATEIRFFIGHRKYLKTLADVTWLQNGVAISTAISLREPWEHVLMFALTASKIFMAALLTSTDGFVNAFIVLMLCDLLWLGFEPRVLRLPFAGERRDPPFLPQRWMWTNVMTAFIILFGSHLARVPGTDMCVIATTWHLLVAGCNCLVDLYKTLWRAHISIGSRRQKITPIR